MAPGWGSKRPWLNPAAWLGVTRRRSRNMLLISATQPPAHIHELESAEGCLLSELVQKHLCSAQALTAKPGLQLHLECFIGEKKRQNTDRYLKVPLSFSFAITHQRTKSLQVKMKRQHFRKIYEKTRMGWNYRRKGSVFFQWKNPGTCCQLLRLRGEVGSDAINSAPII